MNGDFMNELVPDEKEKYDRVVVRSYTVGIYLYPSMIVGLIIWILDKNFSELIQDTFNPANLDNYIATIWFIVFTFNIIVISFDFTLGKVFTVSVLIFSLILGYTLIFPDGLNSGLALSDLLNFGEGASSDFYFWISMMILVILVIDIVRARFDYWVFTSNRIEHHRGIFEREMSFNAQNSRVTTQTDDIFERVLFLAGTIFVSDPDRRVFPIYNVFGANGKDKKIQNLLSVVRVRAE